MKRYVPDSEFQRPLKKPKSTHSITFLQNLKDQPLSTIKQFLTETSDVLDWWEDLSPNELILFFQNIKNQFEKIIDPNEKIKLLHFFYEKIPQHFLIFKPYLTAIYY